MAWKEQVKTALHGSVITNPLTKGTSDVHASFRGDAVGTAITGAFTNPDVPRNLRIVFGATWDAGDVTLVGTDALSNSVTEVFADNPGNTVTGVRVFATVTSGSRQSTGTDPDGGNTITVGTEDKLGLSYVVPDSFGLLYTNDVLEAVTIDTTYSAVTPTTLPEIGRA